MIKTLNKLGIEGNFLSLIKGIYEKSIADITFSDEKQKALTLTSGITQECVIPSCLFNIILEVPATDITQEEEI